MTGERYPHGTSNSDRRLLKAFGRGKAAANEDKPRSANPHEPSGAPYAAWDCGWCEEEEVYAVPAIADQSPKGRDAQRLDAKHASGGARSAIARKDQP